jgi:predicted nucleotidyltransferase
VTRFDPTPYAEGLRQRHQAEVAAIRASAELAIAEARRLALAIGAKDPQVRRVVLFGSLAQGGPRRQGFDIDLALDGGDPQAALELVEGCAFDVDLVELGRLPVHLQQRIGECGLVLFSRAEAEPT